MAQFVKTFYQELNNKKRTIRHCEDVCFTGDNLSDMIGVYLTVDGQPYTGGGTVSGTVINSRGQTIPITTGAISGNLVTVTLEQAALAVPGLIGVYVKLTTGTTVTTVLAAKFTVEQTETDTPIDPGTVISSVDALITRINTAVESIPADYSELLAGVAPSFSSSTAYTAGQYVWYPGLVDNVGALYRFTADHAAGSWTGTDAAAVAMANDVADLRSALDIDKNSTNRLLDQVLGEQVAIFRSGYYNTYSDGTVIDITAPSEDRDSACAVLPCAFGQSVTIRSRGFASPKATYGFLNAQHEGIAVGPQSQLVNESISVPENAAYIVVNNDITKNTNYFAYITPSIREALDEEIRVLGATLSDIQSELSSEARTRRLADIEIENSKLPYPTEPVSKYGEEGQILASKGDGHTEWVDVGRPTDEQTATAVSAWLNAHPEATTTVEDRSLTNKKLELGTLGFVTPEMFGAVGDGVADDSGAIQQAIYYAQLHSVGFRCSGKVYGIATPIKLIVAEYVENEGEENEVRIPIYNHPFVADFNGSTLKAIAPVNEILYINTESVAGYDTPGRYPRFISNCVIDCAGVAQYGIHDIFGRSLYFTNFKIQDVANTAFMIEQNVNGGGVVIDTMVIDHNLETIPKVVGLDVGVSDAKISHVKMRNVNKAVILRKSACFLDDIHPYLAAVWCFGDSICYDVRASVNHFESCYADTYEICWNMVATQQSLSNCQAYWAMSLYPETANIPVIFNMQTASAANYLVITNALFNAGSYKRETGNNVKLFNFPSEELTGVNLYDLQKNSAYANWSSIDNIPIVANYYYTGNYNTYQTGKQIGQARDINGIMDVGRYYTLGQNLPINSPVSGMNFTLYVDYVMDTESLRRRQTLITQRGETFSRTCDTNGVWNSWVKSARYQTGTVSIPFTSGGETYIDVQVTFDTPFPVAPVVMLTPTVESSNTNYTTTAFLVHHVTTSGFVARAVRETAVSFTANLRYVAIV